jgi:thioesterase domain-containing protein/non-ribosomal peptide synthetase component F
MTATADPMTGQSTGGGADAPQSAAASTPVEYFVFPLSPQQEGFRREDCALPGNPAYNGAFRHELTGPLDVQHWEAAWNALIARHEALRSCVRAVDGRAMLAIAESMTLSLVTRDLRQLPPDEREAEMERLCVEDARYRFELGQGPLIRVSLIQLADERFVQTLTLHHLVCDGWSIGILMDELPEIYGALVAGKPLPGTELEIQFGDYLAWLEAYLGEPEITAQTAYWTRQIAGYRRLDVAPDLMRPAGPLLASDIVSCTLPNSLIQRLHAFSNAQGGTLFITGLTALMALLHRETGRDDLSVGSPVAGRNRPEWEKLVGPLLNYVLIRVHANQSTTLRELETTVRDTLLDAFANQDVPFEHVVDVLSRAGEDVPHPLYTVSFVSQRAFAGGRNFTSESAGVKLRTLPSKSQGALYDLFFFLVERENGWRLSLDYRTELFSRTRAENLLARLVEVMEAIADRPDALLSALFPDDDVVLAGEREAEPVVALEDAATAGREAETVPQGHYLLPASYAQERFWLLSRAAPDSSTFNMPAALRVKGPLDAATLKASLERVIDRHEILRTSFEEVDGVLNQVIAPSVALPMVERRLDGVPPSEIDARLRDIIHDEGAIPFHLTKPPLIRCLLVRLSDDDHLLVLTLHDIASDAQSVANLQHELWVTYDALRQDREPDLTPAELQYGDYAVWQREWVGSEAAATQLAFWKRKLSSPLPVLDFPLDRQPGDAPRGGVGRESLSLPGETVARLKELARKHDATMFALTGAAFGVVLARYARQDDILFGSPVANRSADTEAILGRFAGPMALRLSLSSDPTLADVIVRARDVTYEALGNAEYPFELLLDQIEARAIGGRNPLFQFYFLYQTAFLRQQRTAELEVAPIPSLGVGTTFELQLALIERDGSVTVHLDYNPSLLDAASARGVLAYFTYVIDILLTDPSQRLSALAEPDVSPSARAKKTVAEAHPVYAPPRSDLERHLVRLWERILKHAPIGIHDDFFYLGGQSILAARLIAAIEKELGIRTSISVLAYARTVADLGRAIGGREPNPHPLVVPLRRGESRAPLFLVHCGGGHLLRYQSFVEALPAGDRAIYGITAPPLDEIGDATTVEQLARRYVAEMRAVQPSGPYRVAGHSFGGLVAYAMAVELIRQGEVVDMVGIFDTAAPSYYRALPFGEKMRMRAVHLVEVAIGYAKLLITGQFGRLRERLADSASNYARKLKWHLRKLAGGRPSEAQRDIEDYLSEFTHIGRRYTPPKLAAGIVLFHATERGWEYRANPTLGWEQVVEDGIAVRYVPGTHESIMLSPNVESLARSFRQAERGGA